MLCHAVSVWAMKIHIFSFICDWVYRSVLGLLPNWAAIILPFLLSTLPVSHHRWNQFSYS